jgi:2'-5' RNA ligase/ribosomal protein S18 acetylase RimI-like enzyme
MPRRRVGVVLLVPEPAAGEIDVLRRALGEADVGRIAPHLTLVPPVNVPEDGFDDALDRLRDAAERTSVLELTLGPPATFLPTNPVLFLGISGDVTEVDRLRDRVFRPPLERALTWPFHPHVTLLDGGDPERIAAALGVLADWTADIVVEGVHLLEERYREDGTRVWEPMAEARFGGPAVVGRGGLELELSVTGALPVDATAFRDQAFDAYDRERFGERWRPVPLAVTARRGGRIVGTADGEVRQNGVASLSMLVVASDVRGEGVGAQLVAAFGSAAAERGSTELTLRTEAGGPSVGFYERLGFVPAFTLPGWGPERRTFVQLTKPL